MTDDAPIVEQGYLNDRVVDIGEFRVARGASHRQTHECRHKHLTYDMHERRVWCDDCKRTIENFDALMVIVGQFEEIVRVTNSNLAEAERAKKSVLRRIAARAVERTLGAGMIVACPHCSRGITAEDLEHHCAISPEYEDARRRKDRGARDR